MGCCKFCGSDRKLIKAHIIPESFFRKLRGNGQPPRLVSSTPGIPIKKSPTGVYDQEILCEQCEKKFGSWDASAADLFLNSRQDYEQIEIDGDIVAHLYSGFDYTKIKLFFISLLWRASVSTQDYYRDIRLGPYEEKVRKMLLKAEPGSPEEFSVVLGKWRTTDQLKNFRYLMGQPFRTKYSGVNTYYLYLGEFIAYVKVDKRPYPYGFHEVMMKPESPLVVLIRDFESSQDLNVLRTIRRNNKDNLERLIPKLLPSTREI